MTQTDHIDTILYLFSSDSHRVGEADLAWAHRDLGWNWEDLLSALRACVVSGWAEGRPNGVYELTEAGVAELRDRGLLRDSAGLSARHHERLALETPDLQKRRRASIRLLLFAVATVVAAGIVIWAAWKLAS
jgi:hypothetical protein